MLIKTKLLIVTLFSLLSLAAIITTVSVIDATSALKQAQLEKLSTLKTAKHGEINKYFESLKGLLISLANHKGTKEAFIALEDGFYKLNDELKLDIPSIKNKLTADFEKNYLSDVNYKVPNSEQKKSTNKYLPTNNNGLTAQYVFIVDNPSKLGEKNSMADNKKYNSTYMKAHKKYHKTFDRFLNSFELYDIFMVDLKGNLIYTDFKEKDYATNLKSGVYSNTGIAKVFTKALTLNEDQLAFDDFAPYEPSYNSAASFIATPIFIDGIKKGVLIFQMPVDRINNMMSFGGKYKEAGLGDSGEIYLIGMDYKMRNNSRFVKDIKDNVVQELGSTIGVWEVKTVSTKSVVEGTNKKGKDVILDYRGISVLSVFDTIDLYGQTKWAIISEIDEQEALNAAIVLRNDNILYSTIILIIILVIFIFFINSAIVKPLNTFQEGLMGFFKYLNKESTDVPRLDDAANHEIGRMAKIINENIINTKKSIEEDRKLIDETISISDKINHGYLDGEITATSSYPALNELKDILNSTIATLNKNLENIKKVLVSYTDSNLFNSSFEKFDKT